MNLSGDDLSKLRTLVLESVVNEADLERLVFYTMNIRLKEKTKPGSLEEVVFELLQWLDANGRAAEFINALIKERPHQREALAPLLQAATRQPTGLERFTTHVVWLTRHRLASGVAVAACSAVLAVVILTGGGDAPVPTEPLPPVHAPHIWKKAFVVSGERFAYASPDNVHGVLEELLSKAEKTILIGVYEFTSPDVKAMLLKAVERRVKVTVLVDALRASVPGDRKDFINELAQAGIEVIQIRGGRGRAFSAYHPKLIVIDRSWVLVQTGNLTPTSVPPPQAESGNRDTGIAIASAELAEYFAGLIASDKKLRLTEGDPVPAGTADRPDPIYQPYDPVPRLPVVRRGGTPATDTAAKSGQGSRPIRVLPVLTPDNYVSHVHDLVASARDSIDIVEPYIGPGDKAPNVGKILDGIRAARFGNPELKVRLILGRFRPKDTLERLRSCCDWLSANEMRVLNPKSGLNLTNKLLIVDRRVSLLASANWSEAGVSRSREVGLMIDDPEMAADYGRIFEIDWERGLKADTVGDD
jgi:phosphatidylserine/phosphatidylglycerophosphate/cardiolipin synthase-like enzyme